MIKFIILFITITGLKIWQKIYGKIWQKSYSDKFRENGNKKYKNLIR
jgi:hypothetical protein